MAARLGGAMLLGAVVALVVATALVIGGITVGAGSAGVGGYVLDGAILLLWGGSWLIGTPREGPLARRSTRIGFVITAVGITAVLISSFLIRFAPEPWTVFIVQLGIGIPVTIIGWIVVGLSVARRSGRAKRYGLLLLAGLALLPALMFVPDFGYPQVSLRALHGPLAAVTLSLIYAGLAGFGYVSLSDGWSWRMPMTEPETPIA